MQSRPAMRREIETVLALVVIVYGIRTALPLGQVPTSVVHIVWRVAFGLLVLAPGVVLLRWPGGLSRRRKALLGVAAGHIYATAGILGTDWTRLGSASATLGLSVITFILYAGARVEGRRHE